MSYYYAGINISDLVVSGSTAVPDYVGFPESTPYQYTSGIDKPYNFSYTIGNTDVSNYATAYSISYNSGLVPNPIAIPIAITGAPGYNFKHISAYCWGGGGGGGGGGGAGKGYDVGVVHTGGIGRVGDSGTYAAILNYPINNNTVNLSVGGGGNYGDGGNAGPSNGGKGNDGKDGVAGGNSYVYVGGTEILSCPGGVGGSGGNGGTSSSDGNSPSNPDQPSSNYTPGYTATNSANSPASPYWPKQNSGAGGSLGNGGGFSKENGNDGGAGGGGYVEVYLTYQA